MAFGTVGALITRFVSLGTLTHVVTINSTTLSDLRTAAGWALLTLVTTALAAALGGSLGGVGGLVGYAAFERKAA